MAIKKKLDEGDIAVLEIIEDEVWFPEFLRTTADGESDKNLWPPISWRHRDYQRMLLTDRSKFLSLVGGRAIGKCEPGYAKILTAHDGYRRLDELATKHSFIVYAYNEETNTLQQRRARAVMDKKKIIYRIRTAAGHKIAVTANHPILTEQGWMPAVEITKGTKVAVASILPHTSTRSALRWHELRWLGYTLFADRPIRLGIPFKPRFKRIAKEFEIIADRFPANWHKTIEGEYSLLPIRGPLSSPVTALNTELGIEQYTRWNHRPKSIPDMLMQENNDNIKIFIEALFAQYANLSFREISLFCKYEEIAYQVQELLLRFGVESKVFTTGGAYNWTVDLLDYESVYRFWEVFSIPGVAIDVLPKPTEKYRKASFMRYDEVVNIEVSTKESQTYAVYVYEDNNYISGNVFVHNTVILEDKIIYEIINHDREFPITPEQVLTTANQAQMTPLLNKLIQRFTMSRFLQGFLKGQINRAEGIMKFSFRSKPFTFFFRIAGSKGENNVVGLHLPRIKIDEAQIYPPKAFTQLLPTLNHWEPKTQLLVAGVPNGLRNSVLFITDQKDPKYKKYRIPSHNNPFYTKEQDNQNQREWGGEQDDRYQQLVLGRHGAAAFQVLSREDIETAAFPFSNYRYNSGQKLKGIKYQDILQLPRLPELEAIVMAIDPGFVDPTVIQILGMDKKGIWKTYIRYTLTRVDFNEQTVIIDWLATHYNIPSISIDVGAGGNGAAILHNLVNDERYKIKNYGNRLRGVNFSDKLVVGVDDDQQELTLEAKNHAANILVRMIQDGELVFSDIDHEGISQMERVSKQKTINGRDRYFILSERGAGADGNDHIFASYICFALALDYGINTNVVKKLGKASGTYT